jgi:SAM-dependent methyltransferase
MANVVERAIESEGTSNEAVYRLVARALEQHLPKVGTVVDVGCGRGELHAFLRDKAERYLGVDVVRHSGYPKDLALLEVDLDSGRVPLPDASVDAVVSAETIEHVENPRALMRELVRLVRPGGWVFVTTPNQLSAASLLCLLARGQFQYFQQAPGLYPAHITALLEIDLRRIASESGLVDVDVMYSATGRVPFTARSWPAPLGASRGFRGRTFSDNVLVCGRKAEKPRS